MLDKYSAEKQKLYLEVILHDSTLFTRVQNILIPEHFDRSLRDTVEFILEFSSKYKQLPKSAAVKAETGIELEKHVQTQADIDWFLDDFEKFAKYKSLTSAILKAADLLETSEFGVIDGLIKDAMSIGLPKSIGLDLYADPAKCLRELASRDKITATGWTDLDDRLFGGFNRGELNVFSASSGVGKSLMLQNLAANWSQAGLNVVYVTLELSEALCAKRIYSMLSGIGTKEILKRTGEVDLIVKRLGHKSGSVRIVYLPAQSTVAQVKAVLKEIEIQSERSIDCILVDYLDLLMPSSIRVSTDNTFGKDKYVSEELRNLAIEYNALLATASQLNRSAVEAESFDHSHIAGGISKINTADNVFGIRATEKMKENGVIQVEFMKTRNSGGFGTVELSFNRDTLRITDGSGFVSPTTVDATKILPKNANAMSKLSNNPSVNNDPTVQANKVKSLAGRLKQNRDFI